MKKLAVILVVLMFSCGSASAVQLFYDDFESAPEVEPGAHSQGLDADPVATVGTWVFNEPWYVHETQVTSYGTPGPAPGGGSNYLRGNDGWGWHYWDAHFDGGDTDQPFTVDFDFLAPWIDHFVLSLRAADGTLGHLLYIGKWDSSPPVQIEYNTDPWVCVPSVSWTNGEWNHMTLSKYTDGGGNPALDVTVTSPTLGTSSGTTVWEVPSVSSIGLVRFQPWTWDDNPPYGYIDNVSVETVSTALLGDANLDTVVSADDYASVQANFGNTGAAGGGLLGDANHDGLVSADDYASVQANFGNTAGSGMSAAPEPVTIALLGLGGLVGLVRKRR